jgi:L-galactose dehydrogenase/L-glyceraldehyde 3-phosphate reductase
MQYSKLGRTGIEVSRITLGAGPIPATMIGDDGAAQQRLIENALDAGVNWIDTAAGYGDGRSERSIGAALATLGRERDAHVATKVRLTEENLADIGSSVRTSVKQSLERLRLDSVTLLQLHNSITAGRGDEATSITPQDVLGSGGVLDAFNQLRDAGLVRFIGLTGIGQADALGAVVDSGEFDTLQVPYNILNPSAGMPMPAGFDEVNYGNIIEACARRDMGVFAIRVFAGGALVGNEPSPHTLKTKFFPLDLYQRDLRRAERLRAALPDGLSVKEAAVRFALSHHSVHSAIVGLSEPAHLDEAVRCMESGPLPSKVQAILRGQLAS